ncbi:hypothetical protein P7K49_033152 [Saguinus oedipus]|uniref:Uncharacterized protein n=1 Tax=Saguinus oedipus TaxID=9490 RepID=A0ABQ9TR36_SAGOE|nr:hypothetical protein P7K49_033152 [Saguinus oedipus]
MIFQDRKPSGPRPGEEEQTVSAFWGPGRIWGRFVWKEEPDVVDLGWNLSSPVEFRQAWNTHPKVFTRWTRSWKGTLGTVRLVLATSRMSLQNRKLSGI